MSGIKDKPVELDNMLASQKIIQDILTDQVPDDNIDECLEIVKDTLNNDENSSTY